MTLTRDFHKKVRQAVLETKYALKFDKIRFTLFSNIAFLLLHAFEASTPKPEMPPLCDLFLCFVVYGQALAKLVQNRGGGVREQKKGHKEQGHASQRRMS